jgi:hypothetical protein
VTRFAELESDFVAFTSEGTVTACYRDKERMPRELLRMFEEL